MTTAPKYKIGDTIHWYCSKDDCVHHAEILFVNYAKVESGYLEVNYEVVTLCNGEERTLFIDDNEVMETDFST